MNPDLCLIKKSLINAGMALVLPVIVSPALAYDVNEKFLIGGVLATTIQCQYISDAPSSSNTCEGASPFQPEVSVRLTESDEMFFKLGFAAGNGLNNVSPFEISPWAADLEDDFRDINGRNRDALLVAWYKYTVTLSDQQSIGFTMGIIDATDYLDGNAYANDEYTQFMNPVLTNGPNVFLPSYDLGFAVQWSSGAWSVNGVIMDVGENDDGNNYNFYSLQLGYRVSNSLGAGNYTVLVTRTSEDFLDPGGTELVKRAGTLVSFDQALGNVLGVWVRVGRETDHAAINHDAIYSGGLNFKGASWGREDDNIGIGYAHFNGGSLDISHSNVAEVYYRWKLGEYFGLTADIQHMMDDYKVGQKLSGWVYGMRAAVEF